MAVLNTVALQSEMQFQFRELDRFLLERIFKLTADRIFSQLKIY